MDAVQVLMTAINKLFQHKPNVFHSAMRDGYLQNNGSDAIDCDAEPLQPWKHGYDIMKTMREVRNNIAMFNLH